MFTTTPHSFCPARALGVLLLAAWPAPLLAQRQFAADPLQGLGATPPSASSMATIDVNADGHPDLILGRSKNPNEVWVNDGHGVFTRTATFGNSTDSTDSLAVADLDADGDLDVFVANTFGQNRLYLGTATGLVDATNRLPTRTAGSQVAVVFDADLDGDLDIVVGEQNAANKLLRNDGTANFTDVTATQMPTTTGNTHALVPFDADGDGDSDLFVGNDRTGDELLLNNGRGTFTKAASSPSGLATFGAAAADLTGDGLPDLMLANGLGSNFLFINGGGGRFTASSTIPSLGTASFAVALGDIDGDGDLDAVFGTSFGQDELWLNDGSGRFTDATARLPQTNNATVGAALLDVDQDTDLDLVFVSSGKALLLANFDHHLTSSGALQVGRTWRLEFARDRGFAAAGIAVPALAVGPRTKALALPPLGNLLLDSASLAVLPPVALAAPSGTGSLPIPVPQDPSLVGQRIAAQAVVAASSSPATARLTNAIEAVVR